MTRWGRYLDAMAGAPPPPWLADRTLADAWTANPQARHAAGRDAAELEWQAMAELADRLTGGTIRPGRIYWAPSGSSANHRAMRALADVTSGPVLVSAVEHASVRTAASRLGRGVVEVPVGHDGVVDLDFLDAKAHDRCLVAVQAVNNEIGTIQPIADVAQIVHRRGGYLLCDCIAQAGRIPWPQGADVYTSAAYKVGAPPGLAAVLVASALPPASLRRLHPAGTSPAWLAAAWADACVGMEEAAERLADFDRALIDALADLRVAVSVLGPRPGPGRAPGILSLQLPGIRPGALLEALDRQGWIVSAGAACSRRRSHVLDAIRAPEWEVVRVTASPWYHGTEVARAFAEALRQALDDLAAEL